MYSQIHVFRVTSERLTVGQRTDYIQRRIIFAAVKRVTDDCILCYLLDNSQRISLLNLKVRYGTFIFVAFKGLEREQMRTFEEVCTDRLNWNFFLILKYLCWL